MIDEERGASTVAAEPPPETAPATGAAATPGERPWWGIPAVVVAVIVVAVAAVWGIRGLLADPVKGTDSQGITTIEGSWEPYSCGTPCIGYVQAGGRSVTVILPSGCAQPARSSDVTVRGRLDTTQGAGTYRAVACPTQP